jgi:hypothetical protein
VAREVALLSKDKQDHGCRLSVWHVSLLIGFLYLYACISYVCVYRVLVENVIFVSEWCILCSSQGKLNEGP